MKRSSIMACVVLTGLLSGCVTQSRTPVHHKAQGALGPYSGSVEAGGLIFVSGKIGQRGGAFDLEVETTLDAVESELTRLGATFDDVVQATVFLTDLDNYARFNEIYGRRMGDPYPARACVEVSRLPGEARVEVQVIALKP
ncbi:MAG: Rid family hydrolase [Planctomycetota bacterium]|nr:Rid family hydrolase [Planctomycetota bacterium]